MLEIVLELLDEVCIDDAGLFEAIQRFAVTQDEED